MKRIFHIRRRRYLYRAVTLGFAVAALVPATALAGYDESGVGVVDPYVGSGISAEDSHGMSAGNGFVLPSAERRAVEQAQAGAQVPAQPATAAVASTVDWSRIALFASLGLLGALGAVAVSLTAMRNGVRPAHP